MKNKSIDLSSNTDSLEGILKQVTAFFTIMMCTYFICLQDENNSVWFCLAYAMTVGVISLFVSRAFTTSHRSAKENRYVWLSALFAFLGITLCYIGLGVYPFGEKTVMIIDMYHQYSTFFSMFRERILSFQSMSYADSVGMGGGLIPLIAYYLCSPYNIIALIFPREYLTEAIAFIEICKITSAAASFSLLCKNVFKKNDYGTVALSVAYSLSAYFIAYSWNVMWLDCLVLLPLIIWGLEKVLKGEDPLLYCISLGIAITTNYYIGYMICIYLVLWFVMRCVTDFSECSLSVIARKFLRFAWTSAVGGLLSMWILVPTAISLRATSGAEDTFSRDVINNFDIWDLFSRTLYSTSPTERGDNLPNIYCTLLAVFMVALFCFCRHIKLKERLGFMGLLAAMALLTSNNWTNFAFHGFHFPNDLPYRNSFLISFTMLVIAVQALNNIDKVSAGTVFKAFAAVAALLAVNEKLDINANYTIMIFSFIFLCLYAAIAGLHASGRLRQTAALALVAAVVFVEASSNSVSMIRQLDSKEFFSSRSEYADDYDVDKMAVKRVGDFNTLGSRIEILPRKTCNDDALFNYSGLTVFASSNAKAVTNMMGGLGFAINGVNSYTYHSYVPLIDSMLNLEYLIFDHDLGNHSQLEYVDYVTDGEGRYRYIYRNKLALPIGFAANNDVLLWSAYGEDNGINPFEMQNKLIEYAADCEPVYTMLSPQPTYTENMDAEISDSYFYAELLGDEGSFTATYEMQTAQQTYVYVDCRAASNIMVWLDDNTDTTWNVTTYEPYIIDLGKLSQGHRVNVKINSQMSCSGNIFIAGLDTDRLNDAITKLGSHPLNVTTRRDGFIEGTVNAPDNCTLFTSIPYNAGWTVYVDGKKTSTEMIDGALLGVKLTAGEHTVTMKYTTHGILPGILLTAVGILLLVLWSLRKKLVYPLLRECVPVLYYAIFPDERPYDNEDDEEIDDTNGISEPDDTFEAVNGFEGEDDAPEFPCDEAADIFEITED